MLDSLAQGLRAAGGVLSPGVSKQLDDEREIVMRQEQAKKALIAQRIIAGVEQGAIDPNMGRQQLAAVGFGEMPEGALGPTPEAQTRARELQIKQRRDAFLASPEGQALMDGGDGLQIQQQLFRRGLANYQDVLAAAKDKRDADKPIVIGKGGKAITPSGKVLAENPDVRPDGTMVERAFATLRTLKAKQNSGAALTDDDWLQADQAKSILTQSRMQIDPVTQQPMWTQPITIPPSLDMWGQQSQGNARPDATAPRPGPTNDVPRGPGRKALTSDETKTLRGLGEAQKQIEDLTDTFSPKFSGFVFDAAAEAAIQAGRRIPDAVLRKTPGLANQDLSGTAEWWQRYYQWANDVRSEKFGLTLTANELAAFERSMPKPSDKPDMVQRGLDNQMNLLRGKIAQNLNAVSQGGFNTDQAEALAFPPGPARVRRQETPVPARTQASPQEASGPIVRRINGQADFEQLPSGAIYAGPDGVTRRKP